MICGVPEEDSEEQRRKEGGNRSERVSTLDAYDFLAFKFRPCRARGMTPLFLLVVCLSVEGKRDEEQEQEQGRRTDETPVRKLSKTQEIRKTSKKHSRSQKPSCTEETLVDENETDRTNKRSNDALERGADLHFQLRRVFPSFVSIFLDCEAVPPQNHQPRQKTRQGRARSRTPGNGEGVVIPHPSQFLNRAGQTVRRPNFLFSFMSPLSFVISMVLLFPKLKQSERREVSSI